MQTALYVFSLLVLVSAAYYVLNHLVARDYLNKGHLGCLAAVLQLLVFIGFFIFPYTYMPPEWIWDWLPNGTWNRSLALVIVCLGMILAFGTMLWFGLRRAFGFETEALIKTGPYRYSRNPQMLGGWMMVLGVLIYRPSFYSLGWVFTWALIGHWMVTNEEIHLLRQFGGEFDSYCVETPRYFLWR